MKFTSFAEKFEHVVQSLTCVIERLLQSLLSIYVSFRTLGFNREKVEDFRGARVHVFKTCKGLCWVRKPFPDVDWYDSLSLEAYGQVRLRLSKELVVESFVRRHLLHSFRWHWGTTP